MKQIVEGGSVSPTTAPTHTMAQPIAMPKMAPAPSESSSPGRKSTGAAHSHIASSCLSQPTECANFLCLICCNVCTLSRLVKGGSCLLPVHTRR